MRIVNESNTDASWFLYNSDDGMKWFAKGSGDLSANGGKHSLDLSKAEPNATGRYYVQFMRKGFPPPAEWLSDKLKFPIKLQYAYAGGEVAASGIIILQGSAPDFRVQAADTYPAETGPQA